MRNKTDTVPFVNSGRAYDMKGQKVLIISKAFSGKTHFEFSSTDYSFMILKRLGHIPLKSEKC